MNLQVVVIIVFYRTKTRDVVIVIVYGGWIYKYLCNQSVYITTSVVSSTPGHGKFFFDTTLCDEVYPWLATDLLLSPNTLVLPPIKLTATIEPSYCWNTIIHILVTIKTLMTPVQIKRISDKRSKVSKQCFYLCYWSHSHCVVLSNNWFPCKSHCKHLQNENIYRLAYWYNIWGRRWGVGSY